MNALTLNNLLNEHRQQHRIFVRNVFYVIVCLNLIFVVAFWITYASIMSAKKDDFEDVTGKPLRDNFWVQGLYLSITTQTTIGAARVVPKTNLAILLVTLQSFSTLALFLGAVLIFIAITAN